MPSQGTSQLSEVRARIAANIDRGIAATGLSNRQVGDRIGSTEHQVWRWRRGKHVPEIETLAALADVLFGGDMAELYADPDLEAAA